MRPGLPMLPELGPVVRAERVQHQAQQRRHLSGGLHRAPSFRQRIRVETAPSAGPSPTPPLQGEGSHPPRRGALQRRRTQTQTQTQTQRQTLHRQGQERDRSWAPLVVGGVLGVLLLLLLLLVWLRFGGGARGKRASPPLVVLRSPAGVGGSSHGVGVGVGRDHSVSRILAVDVPFLPVTAPSGGGSPVPL